MKKITMLTAIMTLFIATSVSAQQLQNGFKGCTWGSSFAEVDSALGLTRCPYMNGLFEITNVHTFAGIVVKKVTCKFYNNQFYNVTIISNHSEAYQTWRDALTAAIGNTTTNHLLDSIIELRHESWDTDSTHYFLWWGDADLDYNIYLSIWSNQIQYQIRADKEDADKKAAEKNKSDFLQK